MLHLIKNNKIKKVKYKVVIVVVETTNFKEFYVSILCVYFICYLFDV